MRIGQRKKLMRMLTQVGVADFSTREEMVKAHELYKLMAENDKRDAFTDELLDQMKKQGTESHEEFLKQNGAKV